MTASGSTAAYRFSVAPMLDCTDRHFRVLMRQISRRALLYSEMVVAQALHHSKRRNKLLDFDPVEHPIALQVGGTPSPAGRSGTTGAGLGLRRDQPQCGLPQPEGAGREFRSLPDGGTGSGRPLCGSHGGCEGDSP